MKKAFLFCLVLLLALTLSACTDLFGSPSYPIEYGESALFTQEQLEGCVKLIQKEFRTWRGCELHSITYAGDQWSTLDNLIWLNELAEARGLGVVFTECALFLTDYHSPVKEIEGEAWNLDYEYTDWQWWLGCTESGNMVLMDWGY